MEYRGLFENKFASSYMRNHKAVTVKNLRCFPRCGPEHKDNGFCGNEVVVRWSTSGRTTNGDFVTVSEFQEADAAPRYAVNQITSEQVLQTIPTLMRGEVHELDSNNGTAHFSRESKGWHYGWMAGRGHGSHAMHEMRVFLFERIDSQNYVCRLVMRSTPFQVTSRKRIRPKKSQSSTGPTNGEDGTKRKKLRKDEDDDDDDEDEEEEEEKPKVKLGKKSASKNSVPSKKESAPPTIATLPTASQPNVLPAKVEPRGAISNFPPPRHPPVFMGDANKSVGDATVNGSAPQQQMPMNVPSLSNRPSMGFHQPYHLPPPPFQSQRQQHQSSIPSNPQQASSQSTMSFPMSMPQQQTQQTQQARPAGQGVSWPYAISSTPPIYHPALTPPIYQHGGVLSNTPPIFYPMLLGNEQPMFTGLPYHPPESSAEDVLAALWNPTPPSSYPSVLQMQKQQQTLMQQREDKSRLGNAPS